MTIRQLAEARGEFERLSGPEMLQIGKTVACKLHKDMAGLGLGRHYQVAGEVLGRTVPSLAALTRHEAAEVGATAAPSRSDPRCPASCFRQWVREAC